MNALELFRESEIAQAEIHTPTRDGDVYRTGKDLLANVGRIAQALKSLGVVAGSHVLILPANTLDCVEAILAVLSLGAVAIPVNPQLGSSTLSGIIEDVRPTCCIAEQCPPDELCASLRMSCKDLILVSLAARVEGMRCHRLRALRDRYADSVFTVCERTDDDVALLLHTSGSTGRPKRIHRTHGQLASFMKFNHLLFSQYSRREGDRFIPNPIISSQLLSHLAAIGFCLEGLYAGTSVYLLHQFDASLVLHLVEKLRCRFLMLIPSLYELLLYEIENQPNVNVSSLQYCMYGGEACPPEIARRIERTLGMKPLAAYGLTECLVGFGHTREALEAGAIASHSCGKHLFGEVRLVDEHGHESLEQGELWVRNGTIPTRSARGEIDPRVTPDGWFRTGDIMSRDAEGNFYHRGRMDDMFLCNGNNVYPAQMEQILASHPAVTGVIVAPVRNQRGQTVAAALVRCSRSVSTTELMEHARKLGPAYAVPAFMEFADEFPVAPSGKLDRSTVRARLQQAYETLRESRVDVLSMPP
jgi:long-chain acyl-CoA synthetase